MDKLMFSTVSNLWRSEFASFDPRSGNPRKEICLCVVYHFDRTLVNAPRFCPTLLLYLAREMIFIFQFARFKTFAF